LEDPDNTIRQERKVKEIKYFQNFSIIVYDTLPRNSKTFNWKLVEHMRKFNEIDNNNRYIISSLHTSNNQLENTRKIHNRSNT